MSKLYDLVNGATPVVDAPKPTSKLFNLANDLYNRPSPILNTTRSINSAYDDIKLNNDERFTTNPDMYETVFQSQAGNMWNTFKQGIDESQNSNYFASQQKAQNKIDINSKLRKSKAVELGVNSSEYQALVQQLNVEDGELQQVVADYQEKIDSNEQEIANEPVSKLYRIKEAVTQAKGGDATTWESIKYTMPSMFGSSASLMGLSIATTFGTGIVKKLVGTLYTGPAAPYVAIGTAILTGLSLASINAEMETQAELGGQIKQAQEMLTAKYMEENGLEDPEQIPPEELENIRMQSMVGIDKLHAEMFAQLAGMNTLEAIVAPLSTFGSGVKAFKVFDTVAKYNKYTRVASTVGRVYLTSTLESQEEGAQFTSEKSQMDAVMGKGDYINKTFIQNLAEDYWDSASSLTLPGTKISGNGKYKDDKMFQFSEDAGGLMGAMFGFTSGGISIIRDIHKYKQTNKELQDKGILSIDDKIFRYKSQVYAKHFNNDSVEFLLEGVRNLMNSKDEKGIAYLTKEEGETEIKNITSAFDKYLLVKKHIDELPLSKVLWNDAKQQKSINQLKSNLLTASMAITRHQDALVKLRSEKALFINANLKDVNVNQVNDLTDLINKNTELLDILQKSEVKTLDYHLRVDNLTDTIKTLNKLKEENLQLLKTIGVPFVEEAVSLEQSTKNKDIVDEESFLHTNQSEYQKLLKIRTQKDLESYWNTKKVDEQKVNDFTTKTIAEFNDSLTKLSEELTKDGLLPENSQLHPVLAYKVAKLAGIATKESDKLARIDQLSDKALLLSKELFKFIDPAINPNEALRKAAQGEIDKILLAAKSSEEVRNNLTEVEFFSLINNNPNISPELKVELEAWKAEQTRLQEEEKVRREQERIAELEKKAQQQAKDKKDTLDKVAKINAEKKEFTFNNQVDAEGNPIIYTSIEVITDNLVTELPVNLVQKDGTKLQVNLLGQTNGSRNFNLLLPVGELGTNPVGEEASEEEDFSGLQPDLSGYDEFENAIDDTIQSVRYTLGQIINWVRESGRNLITGSTFRVIKRQENGEPEVDINHIDVKVDNDALMEFIKNPEDVVQVKVVKNFFVNASESEKAKFALSKKLYPKANVAPFGIYDSKGRLLGYIALPKESSNNEATKRQQDAAREYTIALRNYLAEQLIKSKTPTTDTKADIETLKESIKLRQKRSLSKVVPQTKTDVKTGAEKITGYAMLYYPPSFDGVTNWNIVEKIESKTEQEVIDKINAKYKAELADLGTAPFSDVVPVYHHTNVKPEDFNFGTFQRGKDQISQFGDGLNASTTTNKFFVKRYGNPIQGEVNDTDFVVIDANMSQKEMYEMLASKGFKFNNPQMGKATPKGASYVEGSAASEYDDTTPLKESPGAAIHLFNDFQQSNPEVKGVKVINHIIGNQKVDPFYVIYNAKSFYGPDTLAKSSKSIVISELTDVEYNNFVNNGIVSVDRINAIAEKIKNNKPLTTKETAIFNNKTSEINAKLQELAALGTDTKANIERRRNKELEKFYDSDGKVGDPNVINAEYDTELVRELYKEMLAGKNVSDMTPAEQEVAKQFITEELKASVDAELAALEEVTSNPTKVTLKVSKDNINKGRLTYRLVRNVIENDLESYAPYRVSTVLKGVEHGIGRWDSHKQEFVIVSAHNIDASVIKKDLKSAVGFSEDEESVKESGNIVAFIRDLSGKFVPINLFKPKLSTKQLVGGKEIDGDVEKVAKIIMKMMKEGETVKNIKTAINNIVFATSDFKTGYNSAVIINKRQNDDGYVIIFKHGDKTEKLEFPKTRLNSITDDQLRTDLRSLQNNLKTFRYNIELDTFTTNPAFYEDKLLTNIIQNNKVAGNIFGEEEYGNQFFSEPQVAFEDPLRDKVESTVADLEKSIAETDQTAVEVEEPEVRSEEDNDNEQDFTKRPDRIPGEDADEKRVAALWTDQKEKDHKEEVDSFFAKNLPGINEVILKDTYSFVNRGRAVFGVFRNMVSVVGENAPLGVRYHEAFHGVFQFLLSDNERSAILAEAREKYGKNFTDKELEEKLADEFMEYKLLAIDPKGLKGLIKRLYHKLLEWINVFNFYPDAINNVFNKIDTAKYAKQSLKHKLSAVQLSQEQVKILNNYYDDADHKVIPGWEHERKNRTIPQMGQDIIKQIKAMKSMDALKAEGGEIALTKTLQEKLFENAAARVSISKKVYDAPTTDAYYKVLADITVSYDNLGRRILLPQVKDEVKKYLKRFGIVFSEDKISYLTASNDIAEQISEDIKDLLVQDGETKDYSNTFLQVNAIHSTSFRVKLLLSGINKFNTNGTIVYDSDFTKTPLYDDFVKVYQKLRTAVQNIPETSEVLKTLIELAKTDKQYQQILDVYNAESDWTKSDFLTSLVNELHKDKRILVSNKGNNWVRKMVDSNFTGVFMSNYKEWLQNHSDLNSKKSFYLKNKVGKIVVNELKVKSILQKLKDSPSFLKETTTTFELKKFMDSIGIYFSDDTIKQVVIWLKADTDIFTIGVNGEPTESFRTAISKLLNGVLDNYGAYSKMLYELAKLDAQYTSGVVAASYKNVNNDQVFAENRMTPMSKVWFAITGKNRLAAIKELISNDTMYKYNNVLNFISSRPQLTKFLEKVSMGGMKVETNKEGKSFTDAQEVENFVNFLTFFQNKNSDGEDNQEYGLYRTTVPADKTIQYLFKLPKYHTNIINGKIDFESSVGIIDLFYNNIAAEAQRIVKLSKLHREGKIHADSILIGKDASKIKKATGLFPFEKFNFIPELNTEEILAKINELTVDVDFKDNVKEIVKDALHKVLQDDVNSTMEMISNNNLEEIIGENDEDLLQLVTDFVLNSNPALSDLHMLFNGDIAQMPIPQKRSYGAGSLLSTLNTKDPISILGVTAGDIIYNRLFRESPKIRDTAEEEMVKQLQEANNKENNPELWAFLDTPEKIAKKDEELRGIAKDYFDKIAVTDSIVYVSDKFMKKLQVADGKWDNNKENAFNKFSKGIKVPKTQSGLFTIWKPFYHGLNANKELNIMSLYIIKSSVVMLNANIVKGDPFLENLYAALQKVDMIVTKDSLKAEIPVLHEINKFNLSADFDESTIVNLDSKYFGNQTDNPEHGLDTEGFGRLQTDATFAAAVKDDSTGVADKINKLLADFPNEGLALLTRLKDTEPEAYHKYMRDETLLRGVSEATEASLAINPVTGKWEIPFNFSSKQSDLIYMIMSSYSKNSVRMGVSGGKFIQIPSIGFSGQKPRDYNEADIRQNLIDAKVDPEVINLKIAKLKQLKNSLRTIRLENGEVQFVEAYATATSKTFYKYNPKTKEYTLKEMSELTDIEREQLTILGNRVPYEGLHSLMPIKIIGFLPAEYGSIIVLPYEVTKQMGSDFDLDSIYFRSMAVYIDTEGKTQSYKYGGSLNERYSQYVSWLINEHPVGRDIFKKFKTGLIDKKIDELTKELEEVDEDDVMAFADVLENEYDLVKLKRFKEDLPKLLIKYLKKSGLLVNKKDFGDTNNPAAIANELLKTYLEELKKPYMLYHMLRPSGFPEITAAHKEVMKHKPKSAFRFFSVLGQMDTEKTSHVGMLLKAMAATHVTSHGRSIIMKLMTSNPLRLKSKKKDSDGRNIIDEYGSLSNKYNRHGIFIADEIGSVLAAIMDDLKDQKLADLNINTSTLSFVCLLVRKGIGLEDALYLVNHPVIIENTELSEANSMLFKASDFKYFKTDDQLLAIEDELIKIAEFFPDDEKINNVLKGIGRGIPILDLPTLKRDLEFLNPTKYEALITPLDGEADLQRQKSLFYYKYNAYKLLKVYNDTKTSDLKEITLMNRAMGNLKSLPGNLEEAIIELQYINDTISMISTGTIDNGTESPYISTISGDVNKYPSIFSAQRALSYAINDILSNTSYKSDFYKLMMSKIEAAIVRSDKSFMSIKEAGKLGKLRSSIKAFLNQYILLQNTTFFSDVQTKEQQKDFLFRSRNIGLRVMNLKEVTTIRNDAFFKNIETTLSTEKNRQEGLAVVSPKFLGIDKNSENDITDALMFWLDHNNILVNLGTTVEDKKNWNEIFEEAHKVAKDLIKYSLLMNGWQYSPKSLTSLLHPDFFEREGTMDEIKDTNTELNNNTYPNSPELQAALVSAYLRNKQNFKHHPKTSLSDFQVTTDVDTLDTSSTEAKYILGFSKLKGVIFAEAIMVKLEEGFTFYRLYKTGVGENGLIDKATYRKGAPLGIDKYYLEVHLDDPNTNVSGSKPLETQHETGENEDVEDEDVPGDDEIEETDISSQLKKRIENEATPDKASKIYSLLGETTATPNVEIDDVAGRKASTKRGIVAYRTRGNDFLKAFNEDRTIGNPWSSEGYSLYTATSVKDATIQFIKWLTGEGHTDKQQEYRQAILDNLDNLKGRKIIYYTERNEPSHATALDYLINKYLSSTQSSTSVEGININTKSSDKLGRELTNPNWGAKNIMDIEAEYKANASKIKAPELTMDEALKYDMNLMYKLQMKKFKAHPELIQEITDRGGVKFLEASEHTVGVKGSRWEGKGINSNFIKVLIKSYEDSLGTTQSSTSVKEGVEIYNNNGLTIIENGLSENFAKSIVPDLIQQIESQSYKQTKSASSYDFGLRWTRMSDTLSKEIKLAFVTGMQLSGYEITQEKLDRWVAGEKGSALKLPPYGYNTLDQYGKPLAKIPTSVILAASNATGIDLSTYQASYNSVYDNNDQGSLIFHQDNTEQLINAPIVTLSLGLPMKFVAFELKNEQDFTLNNQFIADPTLPTSTETLKNKFINPKGKPFILSDRTVLVFDGKNRNVGHKIEFDSSLKGTMPDYLPEVSVNKAFTGLDQKDRYVKTKDYRTVLTLRKVTDDGKAIKKFDKNTQELVYKNGVYSIVSKPTQSSTSVEIIPLNESQRFTRESAEKDTEYMYLFTDNAGRTSGSGVIDPNSWYAKKYGTDKKYAEKTQAVARGLKNVYPITTMVDDKRTQWTDAQFDTYKKIIDDEISTIKQAAKNYKGIKFGGEMPFGKGAISNMKDDAPKIWNYLNTKLAEIGIDNTGDMPTVITQSSTSVKEGSNVQTLKGKLDGSKLSEVEGKLEANKDRLIELLGSSMYSEKLKDVVYKELLQNAFDATKIAESKGLIDKGKINIEINEKERIISFTDNGIGMTSDIVQKAFFTIGGTYKGEGVDNKLKSGGLGLAKMAFIFGSEQLILETVNNGIKTTVNATSQEIRTDNFKIKSEQTSQKNGTKVSVKIPKTYIDSKGEDRAIDFPMFIDSELTYSFLSNPLLGNVDINYSIINRESPYREEENIQTDLGKLPEGFILFSPAKTSFADMDIYIDTKNVTRGNYGGTTHSILSSGLFQFNKSFKTQDSESIPLNIIIDIKPKVEATNIQYPFNNQRENFKPTVVRDISALNAYLALLWKSIEIELLKNSFSKIKNINAVDVENVDNDIIEANKNITKEFISSSNSEIILKAVEDFSKRNEEVSIEAGGLSTKELSLTKEDIDKEAEKAYSRTFKADKNISINRDSGVNLDSSKPIIHNNTNMNIDAASTKFLSEVSSIMLEYKKSILDFYGENYSPNIKEQLWGVSIDKEYGGVNVNPSFLNMLAINPFYNFPTNPKVDAVNYIAVALDHLIIHELNHNFERNEGAYFTGRFLTTYSEIHSLPNHFELMSKLKLTIKNNLQTIKTLNYEYEQSENVESGFEGNKIEDNNQGRADIGIKTISKNDSSNNARTTSNDTRSSEKFGEIINSNILVSSSNKDVIDSFKRKIEAIDSVFKDSPELASIGNKAQYLQYLSTIFKTSQVKDIVYHFTTEKGKEGIFKDGKFKINKPQEEDISFTENEQWKDEYRSEKISVLLNIKNPTTRNDRYGLREQRLEKPEIDGGKIKTSDTHRAIVVFEPEQIHILGGKQDIEGFKQDIEGFKKFVNEADPSSNFSHSSNSNITRCSL